jgi:hypothetical protein
MTKTKTKKVSFKLQDNMAVALTDLAHGDRIDLGGIIVNSDVPAGQKWLSEKANQ